MDPTTPTAQPPSPQQPGSNKPEHDSSQVVLSKRMLIGALFVAMAIIAVPITLMQLQQQQDNRSRAAQDPTSVPAIGSDGNKQSYAAVIETADKYDASGDYDKVAQILNDFIATNPSTDDKNKASLKLASAYFNAKNYDKAITQYEQLKQTDEYKLAALHGIAFTYQQKGDKQKAIDYFTQAIDFMKANGGDDSTLLIAGDEQTIKTLQGN